MDYKRSKMTRRIFKHLKMTKPKIHEELNPDLWQKLPKEILEKVLGNLSFERLVSFRAVCKEWNSDVIPSAALHLEASSRSTLLYFGFHGWLGSPWWLQLSNAKSESVKLSNGKSGSVKEFHSKSFPAPNPDEYVRLLICEKGLLFFGFICNRTGLVREIVVCNPLLSKSRRLSLPGPIQEPRECGSSSWDLHSFVGVSFDSETGSYCLLLTGVDKMGKPVSFLYFSLTSAWVIGSSFLPALWEALGEVIDSRVDLSGTNQRSVCCNGNLYWYVRFLPETNSRFYQFVLKFDISLGTWSVIPDIFLTWCEDMKFQRNIISHKGEVLLWHLHGDPMYSKNGPPELLSCELFDQNRVQSFQYIDWPCRSDRSRQMAREMAPEIKSMPHHMMEKIYRLLHETIMKGKNLNRYEAVSQNNSIYHIIEIHGGGLQILVNDISLGSCTELPIVLSERFPESHRRSAQNVWSFSASLTSLP